MNPNFKSDPEWRERMEEMRGYECLAISIGSVLCSKKNGYYETPFSLTDIDFREDVLKMIGNFSMTYPPHITDFNNPKKIVIYYEKDYFSEQMFSYDSVLMKYSQKKLDDMIKALLDYVYWVVWKAAKVHHESEVELLKVDFNSRIETETLMKKTLPVHTWGRGLVVGDLSGKTRKLHTGLFGKRLKKTDGSSIHRSFAEIHNLSYMDFDDFCCKKNR